MVQQPDPPAPPLRSTTDVGVGVGVASVASIEVDIDDIDMTDPTDNAAMVNNNNDNNIVHNNRRGTEADADDDDDEDGGDVSSTESVPAYNDASSEEEEIEDPEDQQDGRTRGGRVRGGGRRNSRNLPTFIVLPPVQTSPTSGSHTAAATTTSNDNRIMKERRKQQDLQFRKRYGRPLFERQESQSNLSQRLTASGGAIAIGGGGVAESSTDDDDNDGGDDVEEARIRNQTSNHGTFGVVPPRRQNCKNGINNPYSCSSTIRRPYRRDQLAKEIEDATYYGISSASSTVTSMISGSRRSRGGDDDNNGGKNSNSSNNGSFKQVLRTLQQAGVTVYLIDAKVCVTLNDIIDAVYRGVISHVLQHRTGFSSDLKCCLYRDMDGRLFNLTLAKSYSQSEGSFVGSLQSFSIVQAATLLVVLCRSFACAAFILPASFNIGAGSDDGLNGDENVGEVPTIVNFRPAYLALILGLVFGEEIGQSWIHVAMHVRGFPSISALTLEEGVMSGSDWLRKALVFILAIAGYTTGRYQQTCTLAGLSLACWVLLANLGSRSYQNMQWKPIKPSHCCGFVSRFWTPIYAYLVAVLTGICFPYLGHSQGKTGGTAAVESSLRIAIVVAALFVLSDYDAIQEFLVVGSKNCNQDYVNFAVGTWWSLSLIFCLTVMFVQDRRKKQSNPDNLLAVNSYCVLPDDDEPLLDEDHASPVGYLVPRLASFPVDPSQVDKGWGAFCCFSMGFEYILGLVVAVGVGGFIFYLGMTDVDDQVLSNAF